MADPLTAAELNAARSIVERHSRERTGVPPQLVERLLDTLDEAQATAAADTSWVRFDPAKKETWPPADTLALLYDPHWGSRLGSWQADSDRPEGGAWYDENSDWDDGWEADDEVWWRPLPPPPGGEQ